MDYKPYREMTSKEKQLDKIRRKGYVRYIPSYKTVVTVPHPIKPETETIGLTANLGRKEIKEAHAALKKERRAKLHRERLASRVLDLGAME